MKSFIFWAMASHGPGISGGDRIYIELVKRWSRRHPLTIVTWREGTAMMARNGLQPRRNMSFLYLKVPRLGFWLTYLVRIIVGASQALTLAIATAERTYLYTASEFWMDSLPGVILKLRYPKLTWVASWWQTAPSPLTGFAQGKRSQVFRLNALALWLVQLPIRPLISKLADYVLVNNQLEKKVFPDNRTIVVLGAVDTAPIDSWKKRHPRPKPKYAAVFQGRFHPQKGVGELIDIWAKVVAQNRNARLAMLGDGPLMSMVRQKIANLKLGDHVDLLGFLFDGPQKYRVFAQSQLVVHPAFYDSGGMATAEAMAFGLPAVGFNLPSFQSYYPTGMVKVAIGDLDAFVKAIVGLLNDAQLRSKLGRQAREFIYQSYSWDFRSDEILGQLFDRKQLEG